MKRDLHTLKGNSATFEFTSLAAEIHMMEDALVTIENGENDDALRILWESIKDQWKFETNDISEVLGLSKSKKYIRVQKQAYINLKSKIKKQFSSLKMDFAAMEEVPIREAFSKYERLVKSIALRQDKSIEIDYSDECDSILPSELKMIDGALIHLFRNAIDHGIESSTEREEKGKSKHGKILIEFYRMKDDRLHLVIKDDGRGISIQKLAEKAINKGIWKAEDLEKRSDFEKTMLIFEESLSTSTKISDISGRGVGLAAAKHDIEEIGGKITVFSEQEIGTQFEIDYPSEEMQERKQLQAV